MPYLLLSRLQTIAKRVCQAIFYQILREPASDDDIPKKSHPTTRRLAKENKILRSRRTKATLPLLQLKQ
jgi:hypothetical protein